MNGDLISRAALYNAMYENPESNGSARAAQLLECIMKAPPVDAEPVRHGKWIVHDRAEECNGVLISKYECSECCCWERHETDYCPNCGARMDLEVK